MSDRYVMSSHGGRYVIQRNSDNNYFSEGTWVAKLTLADKFVNKNDAKLDFFSYYPDEALSFPEGRKVFRNTVTVPENVCVVSPRTSDVRGTQSNVNVVDEQVSKPVAYVLANNGDISCLLKGRPVVFSKSRSDYSQVLDALRNGNVNRLLELANPAKTIQRVVARETNNVSSGKVEVKDGEVYYNGKVLHNTVTSKILDIVSHKLPWEPMARFLEKLMQNPSHRAVNELYPFLAHKGIVINEDGDFIGYKKVDHDYLDKHSRSVLNKPGSVIEMERNLVSDDFGVNCSEGYHVGSFAYARDFGAGIMLLVKVNPKDVVAVPTDCECQKLRTCRYEVLEVYAEDDAMDSVYHPDIQPEVEGDDWDEDEDDYDEYDDWEDDED